MKDFSNFEIKNRKAEYEYFFVERFIAGISLTGSEVKSIRNGEANISDAYCHLLKGEIFIKNMHISEYKQASMLNHEPMRDRKLLLRKQELKKIDRKIREKGFTLIPYRLFFSERGHIKIEIALSKGKKSYDKRETIKQRENKRELDRLKKEYK